MGEQNAWGKIRDSPPASSFLHITEGIKTGIGRDQENHENIFIVNEEEKRKWQIKEGAVKPLLRAKDMYPFRYRWREKWIIYPNQPNFKDRFPNAVEYLKTHKIILRRRGAVWIFGKKWWELEDPLEEEVFHQAKLVFPLLTRQNSFSLDKKGYFCLDDCILAYPKSIEEVKDPSINEEIGRVPSKGRIGKIKKLLDVEEFLLYLLGIFNSQVVEWFLKKRIRRTSYRKGVEGTFYWYLPKYVRQAPIPLPTPEERGKVAKLVKKYLQQKNDSHRGNEREKEEELRHELNEVIFDIFDLEEKEKAKIQVFLSKR